MDTKEVREQASSEIAQRFEKWWAESRKLNPDCGCEQRGQRWFKCSYHEGADDAWEWAERDTRERCAQLIEGLDIDEVVRQPGTLAEFWQALAERIRGKE